MNSMQSKTIFSSSVVTIIYYGIILVVGGLFFHYLYTRYLNFNLREIGDSATYMQVAWSTIYATPFTMSINDYLLPYFPYNFLGDQLIFILALISPLLKITTSGVLFLVLQVFIIISGAALLYHYSGHVLNNRLLSALISMAFVLNPATLSTFLLFGFRAETFFIPLIFALFLSLQLNRLALAYILVILILCTKHNAIPIIFLLGIIFIFSPKDRRKFGIYCLFSSIVYYIVGVKGIMGSLQEDPVAHFKHFSQFGRTPVEAVLYMVTNPSKILSLVSKKEIYHLISMLLPAGFLALLTPVFWVSSPQLLMNLVLTDYQSIDCGWHWALVVPFAFIGITMSLRFILNHFKKKYVYYGIGAILLLQVAICGYVFMQTYRAYMGESNAFYSPVDASKINSLLSSIPADASLMVSAQLLWHTYDRKYVHISRVKFHDEVDFIAILLPFNSDGHYENMDKYLIREFAMASHNKASRFDGFDLIYKDAKIKIFKNKRYKMNEVDLSSLSTGKV